jgi:hypothetical protein
VGIQFGALTRGSRVAIVVPAFVFVVLLRRCLLERFHTTGV